MQVSSTSHAPTPVKSPVDERPPAQHAQEPQPKPAHAKYHHHDQGKHVDKTA